jgi:hypothetical protein
MRVTANEVGVFRLHTDKDGCVWFGDDERMAVNSWAEPADFVRSGDFPGAACVRLLGVKGNAALVVTLQSRRLTRPGQRVQLASPAVLATEGQRVNPRAVLQHLRQPAPSCHVGCYWHDMTDQDYVSYALAFELADDDGRGLVPEAAQRTAAYHPAWPALRFVPDLNENCACRLLAEIVDPRWFRHPGHPGRFTRLYSHLGLTPENMAAYLGLCPPGRHAYRAGLAVRTWYNRSNPDRTGFFNELCGSYRDPVKGLLRGTQRLVNFVQAVWLHAVQPPHPEVGFDPYSFFKDEGLAQAFEQHRAAWKPAG